MDPEQRRLVEDGDGFFAALDQSGGSTPKALSDYGVTQEDYHSEPEMFDLVHAMRTRIMTSSAFDGARVLAAILFEDTMERAVAGVPTADYLWEQKRVVPFLKVDLGLAPEESGVRLMKPLDTLDPLLERARAHGIFGTKMRSVIADADAHGVNAVVDQQFGYAVRIAAAGLVPILEPEVSVESLHKPEAEVLLRDALAARLDDLPADLPMLLKLTIPTQPDLYAGLAAHPSVLRVLALSGGYSRDKACALLAEQHVMIASFSRALLEGLSARQSDQEFHDVLEQSISQIYAASARRSGPA